MIQPLFHCHEFLFTFFSYKTRVDGHFIHKPTAKRTDRTLTQTPSCSVSRDSPSCCCQYQSSLQWQSASHAHVVYLLLLILASVCSLLATAPVNTCPTTTTNLKHDRQIFNKCTLFLVIILFSITLRTNSFT